jgi:hypothetical protein
MQQTMSRPQPNMQPNNQNNGPARTQSLIITAITLFALSGLIIGFATGAATRPQQAAKPTTVPTQNPIAQQTKPTPVPTVHPVALGCPNIDQADGEGIADGTTTYQFQMHIVGTTNPKSCDANTTPVQSSGITCKLWLSKIPGNKVIQIPASTLSNVDAIKQPIEGEVTDSLIFNTATPQTQLCNSQGQGAWKFSVSPNAKHGTYYLVVLIDWNGQYSNWSWSNFTIKKNG